MFLTIIIFVITLLVLVVSHEFGHFAAAKRFGIKVLEFGFGLPPRIFGKKFGETIYSLNLLPIGGFVRLLGEDEVDKKLMEDERSFASRPVYQRVTVVVAGVLMNLALAVTIFYIVLSSQGFKEKIPLMVPFNFIGAEQINEESIVIGPDIAPNSPAQNVGIKGGDRVLKFNDITLTSSDQLIDLTKQNAGQQIKLTLLDPTDKEKIVEVTPRQNPPQGEGALGIQLGSITMARLNYQTSTQKLFAGFSHSYNLSAYSFAILGELISLSIAEKSVEPVSQTVAGPVGITSLAGDILRIENPLIPYLNFVALLSLNLAIINILPFPALDGGRLVFLLLEGVFRKKVKAEIEKYVHAVGMALLIALIVVVTFADIRKLLF